MLNKIYDFLKENIKEILIFIAVVILFSIKFPYYIDSPGGTLSLKKRFEIENASDINGDISLVYVAEREATIPALLLSFIFKDWDIIKREEVMLENENTKDVNARGKINFDQSLNNAIIFAFKKANKPFEVLSAKVFITYVALEAKTDLKVGDQLLTIDEVEILNRENIAKILETKNIGDHLKVKVLRNNKEFLADAEIIELGGEKKVGIVTDTIYDYKLSQDVKYKKNKSEMGSSGGFATALFIYSSLTDKDIIKSRNIIGTGTIDENGDVGAIGGVKYKLKSALKAKADVFFISNDNCDEANKIKKEKKYDLNIVCIKNFDDAINYLEG